MPARAVRGVRVRAGSDGWVDPAHPSRSDPSRCGDLPAAGSVRVSAVATIRTSVSFPADPDMSCPRDVSPTKRGLSDPCSSVEHRFDRRLMSLERGGAVDDLTLMWQSAPV